jgi:carbonic anhydrase
MKERPGVCFLVTADMGPGAAFGASQSPINLDPSIEVREFAAGSELVCNYETVDPLKSYRFNQVNESYYFPLSKVKRVDNDYRSFNYMNTATINLFDFHIQRADFFAQQFHFHSPSEHSLNGKLLDLEMHIVHLIQDEHNPNKLGPRDPNASQFFAGVLGFLFKVEPDEFFESRRAKNPEIEYHDNFLLSLIDEQKHKIALLERDDMVEEDFTPQLENLDQSPLNLNKFVKLINFQRRFTYQGSLTTAPCAEGILWNVVENVIPIKQRTIDEYNHFRRVH